MFSRQTESRGKVWSRKGMCKEGRGGGEGKQGRESRGEAERREEVQEWGSKGQRREGLKEMRN